MQGLKEGKCAKDILSSAYLPRDQCSLNGNPLSTANEWLELKHSSMAFPQCVGLQVGLASGGGRKRFRLEHRLGGPGLLGML